MPGILSNDARRSRPLAPFGLRFRCSNTRVCSAPVLDQASPSTGLDGRASLKVLAMDVTVVCEWTSIGARAAKSMECPDEHHERSDGDDGS
jgi:hypothetical protein